MELGRDNCKIEVFFRATKSGQRLVLNLKVALRSANSSQYVSFALEWA